MSHSPSGTPRRRRPASVLAGLVSVVVASLLLIAAPLLVDSGEKAVGIPPNGSSTLGAWSGVLDWPTLAVHAVLSPAGKVVTWGNGQSGTSFDVWDPALGTGAGSHQLLANSTGTALFCSGQHVSPTTGEILTFGGELPDGAGGVAALRFAPGSNVLTDTANPMVHPRWYPTTTTLPDGRTLVQGGSVGGFDGAAVITPELFTPGSGWTELTGATSQAIYGYPANAGPGWYYPRTWVQSDGRIFGLSQRNMYYIDPSGTGSITPIPGTWNGNAGHTSTAVMYQPDKVLQVGGIETNGVVSNRASIIDLSGPTPTVTLTRNMNSPRAWADSTVLPNGKVLVTGGSGVDNQLVNVALKPEIWDPATGVWTELSSGQQERLYHSTSLLLPDGAVLLAGGGEPGPVLNDDAEVFYPPYLFNAGGSPAARPGWLSAPTSLPYSGQAAATVKPGDIISRVTLIKTGSVTHSFDMEQRFMELPFTQNGNTLSIQGPPNANLATPGHYLLYAIDGNGVPSVASIVRIGASIVNHAPTAAAAASSTSGTAPFQVAFSSVGSSDLDGDPLTYSWDFGDGNGSSLASPTHTYAFGGTYDATLTVRDDKGWWGTAQVRLQIQGPPPPPPPPPAPNPTPAAPTAVPPGPAPAPPKAKKSPRLKVSLVGPRRVKRGGVITYRVVLRNRGRAAAKRVIATERAPKALRLTKRSRKVSYNRRRGLVKWRAGTLRPGQRKILVLRYRVPKKAKGSLVARASAKGTNTNRKHARRITGVRR